MDIGDGTYLATMPVGARLLEVAFCNLRIAQKRLINVMS